VNAPFRQIGEISDPAFGSGLCCGTLYELPQQVGSLQAGTLLWAASVGKKTERMATRIYRSNDEGRSWSYIPIKLKQAVQLQREADGRAWRRLAWRRP
jgi:hypothetical protein